MDEVDQKIHIELLKRLKIFSETYISDNSPLNNKKSNYSNSPIIHEKNNLLNRFSLNNDEKLTTFSNFNYKYKLLNVINQLKSENQTDCHEKTNSPKSHKKRFSLNPQKKKKTNLNENNKTQIRKDNYKDNYRNHHKNRELINNIYEIKQLYNNNNNDNYKKKEKPIKKNFVNQKFKIADDFNEENSNKFLNEKDECLKEVILSDKIKKEKPIPIIKEDEKEDIYDLSYQLSSIRKNESNNCLISKKNKSKKGEDDTTKFLSELIKNLK